MRRRIAGAQAALNAGQKSALRLRQDHPVIRLRAGVSDRVIHLIERVGSALGREHAAAEVRGVARGRGPGAVARARVHGAHVEFHHHVIGQRWNGGGKQSVPREVVPMRAVIKHGQNREGRRRRRVGVAVIQRHHQPVGLFVVDAGLHRHALGGTRHEGKVRHTLDERCGVVSENGIDRTRRAAHRRAGRPVLTILVRHVWVDQFQRHPSAVLRGQPVPSAQPQRIRRQSRPHRPVATVGVGHTVHFFARRIQQPNLVVRVAQASDPVAPHIGHAGVVREEVGAARRDHEIAAGSESRVGEGELHALAQSPTLQVHGVRAAIEQFHPLLARVLSLSCGVVGVEHDFIDDHVAGPRRRGKKGRQEDAVQDRE